jgi:ElaB/YqjD/DUF883 family membrane-anchored ribosome-binding protein
MMNTELTAGHSTVDTSREKLVKDLKVVAADANDLLKEVAGSTAEGFAAARTKIEAKLGEAKSRLDDARIAVSEKAKGVQDATEAYVKEKPLRSFGIAAAIGVIIGFLLRRR